MFREKCFQITKFNLIFNLNKKTLMSVEDRMLVSRAQHAKIQLEVICVQNHVDLVILSVLLLFNAWVGLPLIYSDLLYLNQSPDFLINRRS